MFVSKPNALPPAMVRSKSMALFIITSPYFYLICITILIKTSYLKFWSYVMGLLDMISHSTLYLNIRKQFSFFIKRKDS